MHREAPTKALTTSDGRPLIFSLIECDETDENGREVTHAPEGVVTLGSESGVVDAETLDAIGDQAAALANRVRLYGSIRT